MHHLLLAFALLTAGPGHARTDLEIHTVLPFDAIEAVFTPRFLPVEDVEIHKNSPIIGVSIGGEQHAYSMVLLNAHEIVNDVVGGRSIASTW